MTGTMTTTRIREGVFRTTPSGATAGRTDSALRFAVDRSVLGWVLVAATDRGIRQIDLGPTPQLLVARLRARFPEARLQDRDPTCALWAAQVCGFIDRPRPGLALPLDVRGTNFQRRVWRAVSDIPPGATASYAEVARRVGDPATAQEVGQALAANPIAVAIPCHRVVRSNGDPGGYRWGVARKRTLLEREAAAVPPC